MRTARRRPRRRSQARRFRSARFACRTEQPTHPRPNTLPSDGLAVRSAKFSVIAALAANVALSACATTPSANSPAGIFNQPASSATGIVQRDLTPQEKKAIVDAVAPSLRNAAAAKYKWTSFPAVVTEDSVNYCAT